jgi:hypothetical protein
MALAALGALALENALQAFQILLQIGAGTGLLFLLRWFWWRINAWSELTAMVVSFTVALAQPLLARAGILRVEPWQALLAGVAVTTAAWVLVTLATAPADEAKLRSFYRLTRPGGPGWRAVIERAGAAGEAVEDEGAGWSVPQGLVALVAGSATVYAILFAIGSWLYGRPAWAFGLGLVAVGAGLWLAVCWRRLARIEQRSG